MNRQKQFQKYLAAVVLASLAVASVLLAADDQTSAWTEEKVRQRWAAIDLSASQVETLTAWLNKQDSMEPDPAKLATFMDGLLDRPLQRTMYTWMVDRGDKPGGSPAGAAAKIDANKTGLYQAAGWTYELRVFAPRTRSESKTGQLFYGRRAVPQPRKLNSYYDTPWGKLYWVGEPKDFGDGGWMPWPSKRQPELQAVKLAPPAMEDLLVSTADDGETRPAELGQLIGVDLKGNPTTGYAWVLDGIDGEAVRQVGGITFVVPEKDVPPAEAGEQKLVGAGGIFHATFEAAKAGKATIRLAYRRPWETGKAPARTFSVTIDVKAAAGEANAEPEAKATAVTVAVTMADDKPRYTLLGKTTGDLKELLSLLKQARENGATQLLLQATKDTRYKYVGDVINVGKAAGFTDLSITTQP